MRNTRANRRHDTRRSHPTWRPHLQLVGPDFRPGDMPARKMRKSKPQPTPLPHQFFCMTCECEITRFDAEVYLVTGRCGPCEEGLHGA
jgi:hypothetical protein